MLLLVVQQLILFTLLYLSAVSDSLLCNDTCGSFHNIPVPFHLRNSCASVSLDAFHLTCLNSTTLYLKLDGRRYPILEFFSDGLLVDFPGTTSCRQYNDLNAFGFARNSYFGLSADNVIGLYDCEDSSLCKAGCETNNLPGCDGNSGGSLACCYPLSDQSVWEFGNGFSVFSKFGCRGFSSWVVSRGSNTGKRGVKLEWAIPRSLSKEICASNAIAVNATTVRSGVRCVCQNGFSGDGFANGTGCFKSCFKDGREVNGDDCLTKRKNDKGAVIVAGVLAPAFVFASLLALLWLLKRPFKAGALDQYDQAHFNSSNSFQKCRTRLFTYQELEEATRGFKDCQKLADSKNGSIYAGVVGDGSHAAVQKVQCENETDLIQVLSLVELLSAILHRNLARLLGCCMDSGFITPLVVYEYPGNGTLEEHLIKSREQKAGLDWYKRLVISAETASVLAFLQYEISPPIFHHDLKSCYIFLDDDYSVKIAGFGLPSSSSLDIGSNSCKNQEGILCNNRTDVYDFGLLLLEIIGGSKQSEQPAVTLQKIRSGNIEEIVDPSLYYHEQPIYRREQIEMVADLATRCLLFGRDGKIGMIDVSKELLHIAKESIDGGSKRGPALEETFSNSSLLQMISMSPDSIYVP